MAAKKTSTKKAQPGSQAPKATQPKAKQAKTEKADKKLSALDAAAKVLAEAGRPMTCRELIEAMAAKGLWKSPGGATPHATLYSAVLRELQQKGAEARFKKTGRGKFASSASTK